MGEMYVLSMIYSYVAVCKCCAVRYLTITGFFLLFSNYLLTYLLHGAGSFLRS